MRRVAPLLITAFVCLAWQADNKPVIDWIRANAIALKTPEAGHGFEDMQPLRNIIGDARVVELGEATHGTREFFQLKHRMLEFLATEMGFTIFSIEANMPEAYRVNDYVLAGKGDPKALLKGMYFWTWDTEEVLAMIEWMRQFNASGKGHVEFTGFDMQTPAVAIANARDFLQRYDPDYLPEYKTASEMTASVAPAQPSFGVATGTFPIADAAGKRVRFSGYIRTENVTHGYAGLWWRVDGQSGVLAFDNMAGRGATGTSDGKRYEIDLPVAADAKNINFGALLTGDGYAWFDRLEVTLDDKPWPSADPLKSAYLGGTGYQVRHDGQTIVMRRVAPVSDKPQTDPNLAIAAWQGVTKHLEDSRARYMSQDAPANDVDWAAQNARIVLQSIQMKANKVDRDASMAANIKWILDQSPKAKMVVWAHNQHVTTHVPGGFEPMGASLRRMLGNSMVAFGFAFSQGGFQAMDPGKGLRQFTVAPAPAGSLDAALSGAGLPLFALDLRRVPSSGPVAEWFAKAHGTRSIGAVYSEDSGPRYFYPSEILKSYDALLFVEKTTSARANPR